MPLETSSVVIGLWEISVDVAFSKWAAKLKLHPSPNRTPPHLTPPCTTGEIHVAECEEQREASKSYTENKTDINNTKYLREP